MTERALGVVFFCTSEDVFKLLIAEQIIEALQEGPVVTTFPRLFDDNWVKIRFSFINRHNAPSAHKLLEEAAKDPFHFVFSDGLHLFGDAHPYGVKKKASCGEEMETYEVINFEELTAERIVHFIRELKTRYSKSSSITCGANCA